MWDTKPDAPAEFRGEFGTISTSVPGIQISDMLPNSAKVMDKWSIIRSLNHPDAGHSTGDQICFTGYPAGMVPDENFHPRLRVDRGRAATASQSGTARVCDDSEDGARHELGLSRCGVQAVRDDRRPGPTRPFQCRTSRSPKV